MIPPETNAARTIERWRMIPPGATVAAALSGGPDSTALLHILLILAPRLGFTVKAISYDHALRPESADDTRFVARMCGAAGVPLRTQRDPEPPARGVQQAARERRYAFFTRALEEGYAGLVATGHTLDDSVETSLMWMLRGAGPEAFGGVPPARGAFIRPLIETRKADLITWLAARGIEYRLDPTNVTGKYLRNRIRLHVIPAMEREAPGAVESVWRLSALSRDAAAFIAEEARARLEGIRVPGGVDPARFMAQPAAIRGELLRLMARRAGLDASRLTFERVEALERLAGSGRLGSVVELPGGYIARLDHGGLAIQRAMEERAAPVAFACPLDVPFGEGRLRIVPGAHPAGGELINLEAAPAAAALRTRAPGDWLRLPNLKGRKSLKKYLVDRKVPARWRGLMPLLAEGNEILWAPGLFVAERISARAGTAAVASLSWTAPDCIPNRR